MNVVVHPFECQQLVPKAHVARGFFARQVEEAEYGDPVVDGDHNHLFFAGKIEKKN